jgi:uncharacterized protein with HEPN domain
VTEKSCSKRDAEVLRIIVKFCDDIEHLTGLHGSDERDFQGNISLQYSCVFAMVQIGEYVKRLSSEFRDDHPEINWREVAGMRDFVVHNYMSADILSIRTTVLDDVPALGRACRGIVDSL